MILKTIVYKNRKNKIAPTPSNILEEYDKRIGYELIGAALTDSKEGYYEITFENGVVTECKEYTDSLVDLPNLINELKNFNNKQIEMERKTFEKPKSLFLDDAVWNLINTTIDLGEYPLMIGPKGCGKTETAEAVANARKMQFYPMNAGALAKPQQTLIGQIQFTNNETNLLMSEFLRFFTSDVPTMIFIDEASRIPTQAANELMTVLDRKQNYIYVPALGKRFYKGKDVVFFGAANFGHEYTDTRNLDGAFLDRFTKFAVRYLDEKEELDLILQRVTGAKDFIPQIKKIISLANQFRNDTESPTSISHRQTISMAGYIVKGYSLNQVLDEIFVNMFINGSVDNRELVRKRILAIS